MVLKASLFDLDHTLLKVNSSFYFGKHLYRQGFFNFLRLLQLGTPYCLHKAGVLSIAALHSYSFKHLFQGHSLPLFEQQVAPFLAENLDAMLYLPAIERLQKAQAAGHFVAILSNSPDFLVRAIAQKLDVSCVEASIYGVDLNHCFSHIEHLVEGESKALWLRKAAETLGIPRQEIAVYSDSILDLPFLQGGGIPVAVNPDRKLRALCQKRQWEMI